MTTNNTKASGSNSSSPHILSTAATMVGVCMTVVSIVKLIHPGGVGLYIDRALAADSILFLLSAFLSFGSIRSLQGAAGLETWAERIFVVALAIVVMATIVLAFEIT